jgi:transcriptional regulator with XRE-family HTH domain
MVLGDRLKAIREAKGFSQGDIEKRTGLLRCYISRCECGHTIPSFDTMEKWARALEIPMYQIFHDGKEPSPARPLVVPESSTGRKLSRKDSRVLARLVVLLGRMKDKDKKLLVSIASKMSAR